MVDNPASVESTAPARRGLSVAASATDSSRVGGLRHRPAVDHPVAVDAWPLCWAHLHDGPVRA